MKRTLLILVFFFLLIFSVQADNNENKCLSVKGIKEKLKCVKGKYENFRDSVPKTGVEAMKKMEKKE